MAPVVRKRKSYTIKQKLDILAEREASGLLASTFAANKGIEESVIRRWAKQKENLQKVMKDQNGKSKSIRKLRRIPRKRIGQFPALDLLVNEWIILRNTHGIKVKDEYIVTLGKKARDQLLKNVVGEDEREALKAFGASKIWCHRFKGRFGFVSRRHTTTHKMPEDFRDIAVNFIKGFQELCKEHNVKRSHIINFDQVPRYFENNMSTTIAKSGSREILLNKSSTSHKRFTYTPFITASGKVLLTHALFSNLVNIPKHHPGVKVSVNKTGMWNEEVLNKFIREAVKLSRGMFDQNSKVIVVLDSYGVHTKFVREKSELFASENVFFVIIPPRLTGLLQPLDVALNRGFQQFFNDCSDAYQHESITQDVNKTKKGNVKMPSCELVTQWTHDYCKSLSVQQIQKAFDVCGLVPEQDYDIQKLHTPLREILELKMSVEDWLSRHASLVNNQQIIFQDFWISMRGKYALVNMLKKISGSENEPETYATELIDDIILGLTTDPLTADMITESDKIKIRSGLELTDTLLEVYMCSKIFSNQFHIVTFDSDDFPKQRTIFGKEFELIVPLYVKTNPLTLFFPNDYDPDEMAITEEIYIANDNQDAGTIDVDENNAYEEFYEYEALDEVGYEALVEVGYEALDEVENEDDVVVEQNCEEVFLTTLPSLHEELVVD